MSEPLQQQQRADLSGQEKKVFRKWFPNLARGYSNNTPRRSMTAESSGPLYREMQNFRIHDGVLRRRSALRIITQKAGEDLLVIDHNGNNDATPFNGQMPLIIKDTVRSVVVLTDREIWIYNKVQSSNSPSPARWINMTPIYDTGTVTVTNGSAVVTGSGTVNWENATNPLLHRVKPGHIFNVDSDPQDPPMVVKTLDSDTQLTLEVVWPGSSGGGEAYEVRRTMQPGSGMRFKNVFVEEHNGEIFIGGQNIISNAQGVVKIVDYEDTGVVKADLIYLCQSENVIPGGIQTPQGTGMDQIFGMKILDDGRVVLAIHQRDSTAGGRFTNRIVFSSHTDQTVWNSAPGGFLDMVSIPGELSAMGRWGSSITLHTERKIAYGHLTGVDNAPLELEAATSTHIGCGAPKTLKTVPGGEMFVARDYQVYFFDGTRCLPVGHDIKAELQTISQDDLRALFSRLDSHRNEYSIFAPRNINASDTDRHTLRWTLDLESGQWTRDVFSGLITAASDGMFTDLHGGFSSAREGHGECFVGRPSFDPDISGSQAQKEMVYRLVEANAFDEYVPMSGDDATARDTYLRLDEQDFDYPGISKVLTRVQVWVEIEPDSAAIDEDLTVQLSIDHGHHWQRSITKAVTLSEADPTAIVDFIFAGERPLSAETFAIWLQGPGAQKMSFRILHMMVHGQLLHPVEAAEMVAT